MAYEKLFEANREVIQDPNKIYPRQKTVFPWNNPTRATLPLSSQ